MFTAKISQIEPSSFLREAGKVVLLGHYFIKGKGTGTNANYFYLTIFLWVFFSYDECQLMIGILYCFLFSGSDGK